MFDGFDDDILKRAQKLGQLLSTHDPCTNCKHGRLLHKKQSYRDAKVRAIDESLPETQCRHGIDSEKVEACTCSCWTGTETPLPEWL